MATTEQQNLVPDAATVKNLRARVKAWVKAHDQYVSHWGEFTRLEGMDYWAVWISCVGEKWGIHVYDDGRIQLVTIHFTHLSEGC